MAKEYIEERDGGHRLKGTPATLDSTVCAFLPGDAPESIAWSFPDLALEEVCGAIAFFLANEQTSNARLEKDEEEFPSLRREARAKNPELYKKLEEARQGTQARRR